MHLNFRVITLRKHLAQDHLRDVLVVPFSMLDKNALSQLKNLKQSIEDSKEYAQGIVKGTQRKFGFVILDDGREIFLNPEEMQKVWPGDEVKILIQTQAEDKNTKGKKAKISGLLQSLIKSPLKEFTGKYIIKGQGHFVEPDLPNMNRWIFIPPAERKNAKQGDFIHCKVTRHPYPQAKPQAKILEVIGNPANKGIEADYIVSKFQLDPAWPEDWKSMLQNIDTEQREDLTDIDFITIDAPSTQDMDDALFAKTTTDGWQLVVAIADPNVFIETNSELDKLIQKRAVSSYLPGKSVPMLPSSLATDLCSLAKGQARPALVCQLDINADGDIKHYQITEATICSKAKLDYDGVTKFLQSPDSSEHGEEYSKHSDSLLVLKALSDALLENRRQKNLIIPNRQDYRMILNADKKLDRIEPQQKSLANSLVEECMVAVNRCAADMLGDNGIFISHPGFRKERLADVKKLAEEQLQLTDIDFSTPEGYLQLMKSIDDDAIEFPIRAVLSRLLERSRLSLNVRPHYGMGLTSYTTFTSPIRKYSDLLAHRMIKAKLHQQPAVQLNENSLANIQQAQDNAYQARYQMEQWLKCDYLKPLIGKTFPGVVTQVNSNGFTVLIDEIFIEGFVESKLLDEKFSFDPMRLRLKSKSLSIQLNQAVEVTVTEADSQRRSIRFTLAKKSTATSDTDTSQEKTNLPVA
jgi:VacB/RNase II family 3'-5' exoribonuclease